MVKYKIDVENELCDETYACSECINKPCETNPKYQQKLWKSLCAYEEQKCHTQNIDCTKCPYNDGILK